MRKIQKSALTERSFLLSMLSATVLFATLSMNGCASKQVNSADHDGNGIAQSSQNSKSSDASNLKVNQPKQKDAEEERISPLLRIQRGRSKSP